MRHLSSKGLLLANDQWLMSLYGNCTKYGGTAADQLMLRVDRVSTLFYRTVERLLKLPYRTNGGVSKEIKENYGLYINAFLPRSFAVSFQVGQPDPRQKLFPELEEKQLVEPHEVVDEILNCFELFEGDKQEELKNQFESEIYYDNFVGLAKQMSPDGEDIKVVGFNSIREGKDRPVALRKKRRRLRKPEGDTASAPTTPDELILSGTLMHANTPLKGKYGSVKLRSHKEQTIVNISVPISLMKDVVQPFYEEDVIIQAHKEKKKIVLDEIAPSSK